MLPLLFSVFHFGLLVELCLCFFYAQEKKINRLEIVLITSLYYTTFKGNRG